MHCLKYILTHMWRMDFPILITLMSPLSFLGASGGIFQLSMKIKYANRIVPDERPRFAASHLGLFCLPLSHKKDARLIWVKLVSQVPQFLKFMRHLFIHTCICEATDQFKQHHIQKLKKSLSLRAGFAF